MYRLPFPRCSLSWTGTLARGAFPMEAGAWGSCLDFIYLKMRQEMKNHPQLDFPFFDYFIQSMRWCHLLFGWPSFLFQNHLQRDVKILNYVMLPMETSTPGCCFLLDSLYWWAFLSFLKNQTFCFALCVYVEDQRPLKYRKLPPHSFTFLCQIYFQVMHKVCRN